MSALAALLEERQIVLRIEGGRLKYRAPRGAMTPEMRRAIHEHRDELVAQILREEQPSEELELFACALKGIEMNSQLGRLYPQMREFLRRELTPEHFAILELAHAEILEHPTPRAVDELPRIPFAGGARVYEPCRWMRGFRCTHSEGPGAERPDGRGCERFDKENQ